MPFIHIGITLIQPPAGVMFSLQDRSRVPRDETLSTGANITFQLTIEREADGRVHGKFAMGPPAQRFLYICSGAYAGQRDARWSRRAKISLMTLPAGRAFVGQIQGCSKDGGPACATVPLLGGGWLVARS